MIAAGSARAFGAMSEFRGDEGRLMEKRPRGSLKYASSSAGVRQFSKTKHWEVVVSRCHLVLRYRRRYQPTPLLPARESKRLRAAPFRKAMCR